MADVLPGWMSEAMDAYRGPVTTLPPRTFSAPGTVVARPHVEPPASRPEVRLRRARVAELAKGGANAVGIAAAIGAPLSTINNDLFLLRKEGVLPRREKSAAESIDDKRKRRAAGAVAEVKDRRRFKSTPVPTGSPAKLAPVDAVGTIFPNRVSDPVVGKVLKDGASNSKIGGDVLVGWLKGARIVTLTLEERATCPRSCLHWRSCYGGGMPFSTRWRHGPELEAALAVEIAGLCAEHELVLVRLHVLGDFYSVAYIDFWVDQLVQHPGLYVFGFTAWGEDTEIGSAVAAARERFGRCFSIRHSGRCAPWGSFTIDFPTERKQLGDAIVCPEQVSAMAGDGSGRHCGSCGACWSSDRPIVFVEHG